MLPTVSLLTLLFASVWLPSTEASDLQCVETPSDLDVEECHDEAYHDHMYFSDCPSMPCRPNLGEKHTLNVHFRPSHSAVKPKVRFTLIFNMEHPNVPFLREEDTNACKYFNVTCPIRAGQAISYNHTFRLPRDKIYSMVPVKVEWQLYAPAKGQKLACLRVPFHMVY